MHKPHRDEGFSLIELLVAVAILAVISIPLLQGFIGTHRAVTRSALLQGATVLSGNIMETMHVHTLEEVQARYGQGERTDTGLKIEAADLTEAGIRYDVVVEIDDNDAAQKMSFASPVSFDAETDLVFTADAASGNVRRRIVLTVTATNYALSKVTCEQYTGDTRTTLTPEKEIEREAVRNVFLVYPPNYASTASTYDEETTEYADTVEIVNPSAYPVRVVLLKAGGAATESKERAYRMRLKTVYKESETCEIYTNLNYNIAAGLGKNGSYKEKLPHQALTETGVKLLPPEGVSDGAGSFYPVRVTVYPADSFKEGLQNREPIFTLTNTEG